ncbi:hypothetical protein STEG23_021270 [Scotinomys teguina]
MASRKPKRICHSSPPPPHLRQDRACSTEDQTQLDLELKCEKLEPKQTSLLYTIGRSLGYPVSGSWPSGQYQEWDLFCGMGLKLDQSLFGHSHKICATFTPAHLAGQNKQKSNN